MNKPLRVESVTAGPGAAPGTESAGDRAGAGLSVEYEVRVAGARERVRVALPGWVDQEDLASLGRFATTTAWLRHVGLLPRSSVNSVE